MFFRFLNLYSWTIFHYTDATMACKDGNHDECAPGSSGSKNLVPKQHVYVSVRVRECSDEFTGIFESSDDSGHDPHYVLEKTGYSDDSGDDGVKSDGAGNASVVALSDGGGGGSGGYTHGRRKRDAAPQGKKRRTFQGT